MQTIGIDLGFGQVKAVGSSIIGHEQKHKFLSVVGTPPAYELDHGRNQDEQLVVTTGEGTHYLGEKAIQETSTARVTMAADKTDRETDRIKYFAVLGHYLRTGYLNTHTPIRVVTGLPVFEYNNLKGHIAGNMTGLFNFGYSGQNYSPRIGQVEVIPQSAGAYFDAILETDGRVYDPLLASQMIMVVDVGYRTTDVVTMQASRYLNTHSFTIHSGISQLHTEMKKYLQTEFRLAKKLAEMDSTIREGAITLNNRTQVLHNVIAQLCNQLAGQIIEEIEVYVPDFREFDKVLLTGGGATLLMSQFAAYYRNMLLVMDQPEFSNAYGYYKYGRFIERG